MPQKKTPRKVAKRPVTAKAVKRIKPKQKDVNRALSAALGSMPTEPEIDPCDIYQALKEAIEARMTELNCAIIV